MRRDAVPRKGSYTKSPRSVYWERRGMEIMGLLLGEKRDGDNGTQDIDEGRIDLRTS